MSSLEMIIEPAGKQHLEQVVQIYNQAIIEGISTADMEIYKPEEKLEWFQSHDHFHPLLIARMQDHVIGWASLGAYRRGRKAFKKVRELSVYVHKDHRSQKVASSLFKRFLELAPSLEIDHLLGIILECNKRSIRFVENNGFELWGRLPLLADFNGSRYDHLYYGLRLEKK